MVTLWNKAVVVGTSDPLYAASHPGASSKKIESKQSFNSEQEVFINQKLCETRRWSEFTTYLCGCSTDLLLLAHHELQDRLQRRVQNILVEVKLEGLDAGHLWCIYGVVENHDIFK